MKEDHLQATRKPRSRIRWRIGDVVAIYWGDGEVPAYAVVLDDANYAIFDGRGETTVENILQRKPMFYVAVMDGAVTTGRWPVVDVLASAVPSLSAPPTFMQDALNPRKFQIYHHGAFHPASREECAGLERTAVWDAGHVEDRIRDDYAGRKNKWLNSLRMVDE